MKLLEGLDSFQHLSGGAAITIGNFDGMHLGHQRLLEVARRLRDQPVGVDRAADQSLPERKATQLVAVTFEPHPLTVLRPEKAPKRLTPPSIKQRLLADAGVDICVILPPTRQLLDLTAEQFWTALRDGAQPAHLVEGPDFSFGKGRAGNVKRLTEWTAAAGVQLHVIDPVTVPLLDLRVAQVSSSLVRWLLGNGRVRDAAIALGRPYALVGQVVSGHQRGRALGAPTANLDCGDQQICGDGVYVGRCSVDGKPYAAAVSVGTMPTFGANARQIEAYLLDFQGDLYGQTLTLELIDWIRDQWKFAGVEPLKMQIERDICCVRQRYELRPQRPIVRDAANGGPKAAVGV